MRSNNASNLPDSNPANTYSANNSTASDPGEMTAGHRTSGNGRLAGRPLLMSLAIVALLVSVLGGTPIPAAAAASVELNSTGLLNITGTPGNDDLTILTNYDNTTQVVLVVDGVETVRKTVTGIKKIKIDLGAGSDSADVAIGPMSGSLVAKLGAGNDYMKLRRPPIDGYGPASLTIDTGSGSDQLSFRDSHVGGRTTIKAGDGWFFVSTDISGWGDDVTYTKSGSGDFDFIGWGNDIYQEQLTIRAGNGDDEIEFVENVIVKKAALIETKGGNDKIKMTRSEFRSNLSLIGGNHDDVAILNRIDIGGRFSYNGGSGSDVLAMAFNEVGNRTTINGSSNDDRFEITGNIFEKALTVNGGSGTDSIGGIANVYNGSVRVTAVENG